MTKQNKRKMKIFAGILIPINILFLLFAMFIFSWYILGMTFGLMLMNIQVYFKINDLNFGDEHGKTK